MDGGQVPAGALAGDSLVPFRPGSTSERRGPLTRACLELALETNLDLESAGLDLGDSADGAVEAVAGA